MAAFVACLATASFVCCGLVLDGGRVLVRYSELADAAENAARAGAQHVSGVREGRPRIDRGDAVERARRHLGRLGLSGSVEVVDDVVTVGVSSVVATPILGMVGLTRSTVRVTRSARLTEG